jgi:hypothetical protein
MASIKWRMGSVSLIILSRRHIALVQRVIVEHVPCLGFGKDLLEKHIPHMYTKETSQPTDSVSIFKKYLGFLTWGEVIPVFFAFRTIS